MAPESPLDATHSPEHAGPVWRDRGTIIANQQARIAELELACQRLRDDYQGALADAAGLRARIEALADEHWLNPVNYRDPVASVLRTIQTRLRALAAEPAPAAEPHAEDGA